MSTVAIQTDSTGVPAAKLTPKEHGAYVILAVPIVTALVVAGPTVAGVCVAAASVPGFLAHEPLLVMLGRRGSRAQRTTPVAKLHLYSLLTVMIVCGAVAFAIGAATVRLSLLGCGAMTVAGFALAVTGKHNTVGGQLWGVVGLSAPSSATQASRMDFGRSNHRFGRPDDLPVLLSLPYVDCPARRTIALDASSVVSKTLAAVGNRLTHPFAHQRNGASRPVRTCFC